MASASHSFPTHISSNPPQVVKLKEVHQVMVFCCSSPHWRGWANQKRSQINYQISDSIVAQLLRQSEISHSPRRARLCSCAGGFRDISICPKSFTGSVGLSYLTPSDSSAKQPVLFPSFPYTAWLVRSLSDLCKLALLRNHDPQISLLTHEALLAEIRAFACENWDILPPFVPGIKLSRCHVQAPRILPFSCDIMSTARWYLDFLEKMSTHFSAELRSEAFLKQALLRTSRYLALVGLSGNLLIPTMDVMYVLLSLLIRNTDYIEFCSNRGSLIAFDPPHRYLDADGKTIISSAPETTDIDLLHHLQETKSLYSAHFGEPYLLPEHVYCASEVVAGSSPKTPPLSEKNDRLPIWPVEFYLSVEVLRKDASWFSLYMQMVDQPSSAGMFQDKQLTSSCLSHYQDFLFRCSEQELNTDVILEPRADLFWHAHLIHPQRYARDCVRMVGKQIPHFPWPDESMGSVTQTDFRERKKNSGSSYEQLVRTIVPGSVS